MPMPTTDMRDLVRGFPGTRIALQIAETRRVMQLPTYVGSHLVGGSQGPDRVFCARFIAVCRAERARRARRGQTRREA